MARKESISSLVRRRQFGRIRSRHVYSSEGLIDRLWLDDELDGHDGCVNCLHWNQNGSLLASGSDDKTVKIWNPHRNKVKVDLRTGHRGIIFSVKFLPGCSDRLLASGSSDCTVRLHDVSRQETVEQWECHRARVKRIDVSASECHIVWSGSEDGTVSRLDTRESHRKCASNGEDCPNAIIKTKSPVKCVAINPVRPHLLAVGFLDRLVRVFDLRFLNDECRHFCPGNIFNNSRNSFPVSVTYVSWSADGRKLLANYSGDQIYMFDVDDTTEVQRKDRAFTVPHLPTNVNGFMPVAGSVVSDRKKEEQRLALEKLSSRLEAFGTGQPSSAVSECLSTVRRLPLLPEAHNLLRLKLKERSWYADRYTALREARFEAALEPDDSAAAFRIVESYADLRWWKLAKESLVHTKERFPEIQEMPEFKDFVERITSNNVESRAEQSMHASLPSNGVVDCRSYYCGHQNELTDIKEANFLDKDNKYIVAGSDDRMLYIWEVESSKLVRAMLGDSEVVNCCQPHPDQLLLATSGIDNTIRLWSPQDMSSAHVHDGELLVGPELEEHAERNHSATVAHSSHGLSLTFFGRLMFVAGEHFL